MRRIILIVFASVIGALSLLNQFIGTSTLRSDAPGALLFALDIVDAAWAWISAPPVWAATIALFLIVGYAIFEAIGDQRRLILLGLLFQRDRRIAALKKIEENPEVQRFQQICAAETALKTIDFTPAGPVPPPPQLPPPDSQTFSPGGSSMVLKGYGRDLAAIDQNVAMRTSELQDVIKDFDVGSVISAYMSQPSAGSVFDVKNDMYEAVAKRVGAFNLTLDFVRNHLQQTRGKWQNDYQADPALLKTLRDIDKLLKPTDGRRPDRRNARLPSPAAR